MEPQKKTGVNNEVRHADLNFKSPENGEMRFSRADLIFMGVDHGTLSYEVRIYLNNKQANCDTKCIADAGYAGKFTVFGHGGCFGGDGHCDVPRPMLGAPLVTQHPLTRQRIVVPITQSLKRVCDKGPLQSVTLVPILRESKRDQKGQMPFDFESVSLRTYR